MRHNDLYGFSDSELGQVKAAIERALDIKFQARESLYRGGDYYYYEYPPQPGHGNLILQANVDLLDDEPAEPDFPEYATILYAENTPFAFALEDALRRNIASFHMLRREIQEST